MKLYLPDITSLHWLAAGLSAIAIGLTFKLHRNIIETLAVCGGLALAAHFAGIT